jgi:hypothetical protein
MAGVWLVDTWRELALLWLLLAARVWMAAVRVVTWWVSPDRVPRSWSSWGLTACLCLGF